MPSRNEKRPLAIHFHVVFTSQRLLRMDWCRGTTVALVDPVRKRVVVQGVMHEQLHSRLIRFG